MAGLLLQVGSMDLTSYVRAQPGEGLAPDGGGTFLEQQFAGSLALSEGQVAVDESAANRQLGAPLWLNTATTDATIALLQQLRQACVQGAQVQFRPEGGSNISYFDLEAADIHPEYDHHKLKHGWLKVNTVLYTRPFAGTGTSRIVGTVSGEGPQHVNLATLAGDADALMNLAIRVGTTASGYLGRTAMWGLHPNASFNGALDVSSFATVYSGTLFGLTSATVLGASGAMGSRVIRVVPTNGALAQIGFGFLDSRYSGRRYRVFSLSRGFAHRPLVGMQYGASGFDVLAFASVAAAGATAPADNGATGRYMLADLGEVTIPSHVATAVWSYALASPAATVGGALLDVNGILLLPVEHGAGLSMPTTLQRDAVSFESIPEQRTVVLGSGVATNVRRDAGGQTRSAAPAVSAASAFAARRLMTIGWEDPSRVTPNASHDVEVRVEERFAFFR